MLSFKKIAALLFLILCSGSIVGQISNGVTVLCYHDIVETRDEAVPDAVYLDKFINQLEWIKSNNIPVISLQELSNSDKVPLPQNAVMLTFDDGYASFYEKVYPLLLQYQYPAILGIVSQWMIGSPEDSVAYGDDFVPRSNFVTWDQVREMSNSGLVNIASHSYNGHRGILSNPQGNTLPFFTATQYDSLNGYESEEMYLQRVRTDLTKSVAEIKRYTGVSPNGMIWPYGRYNDYTVEIANDLGMEYTFALNYLPDRLRPDKVLNRFYMNLSTSLEEIESWIDYQASTNEIRFLTAKIDEISDPEDSLETQFGEFINEAYKVGPNLLFMAPTLSDSIDEGVYFNTSTAPTYADRQTRIIWQVQSRLGIDVHLVFSEDLLNAQNKSQFFHDMGRFSPAKGVLMEDSLLIQHIANTTEAPKDIIITSQTRRDLRKAISKQFQSLQYLERFQSFQPILEVGITLNIKQLSLLTEIEIKLLYNYFDYFYIDMNSLNIKQSLQLLSSLNIPKPLRPAFLLQLSMESPKKTSKIRPKIEAMGYLSYGFDLSILNTNRSYFVSSSSFPYKR